MKLDRQFAVEQRDLDKANKLEMPIELWKYVISDSCAMFVSNDSLGDELIGVRLERKSDDCCPQKNTIREVGSPFHTRGRRSE
jgi:hypothetical protein